MGRGASGREGSGTSRRRLTDGLTDAEQRTLATYEDEAAAWAAERGGSDYWEAERERFATFVPQGHLLDVGSGNGRDAVLLCDHGYQVTGIDISRSLLEIAARQEPRAHFLHASVYELPFPDGHFDGAWVVASLLHLPRERVGEALAEIRRVLRPDGGAFFALKKGSGEGLEAGKIGERYFCYWEQPEFERALEAAGFVSAHGHERDGRDCRWLCVYAKNA